MSVEGATRERRRKAPLLFERRHRHFVRAALVGLLAGIVAVLFQWGLYGAESARAQALRALHAYPAWGWAVLPAVAAVLCGLSAWMTRRWAPEASGSGIPHVKATLLHLSTMKWKSLIPVKFLAGILAVGPGMSLGREGPTVQLGAAVGQALEDFLRVPRRSRGHLLACGAGAGLAAAFNAPLAGFIFVIEEVRRELSPITYGTALIAAVCSDIVTRAFQGQSASLQFHGFSAPELSALPFVAAVGIVCGLLGVAFNRAIHFAMDQVQRWGNRPAWIPASAIGAVTGLVAWWLPQAVGSGHATVEMTLRGEFSGASLVWTAILLCVAKFVLTVAGYATKVPGGIFAPLLVIGSLLGLLIGEVAAHVAPALVHNPEALAVIGMAAYFAAVVRAPLTGIVLILEMTANYELMFALAVACLPAYMIADRLGDVPIYDALLRRDIPEELPERDSDEPMLVHRVIEPHSVLDGRLLRDAGLPRGCLIVTIKRGGRETLPDGSTRLRAGDEIVAAIAGDVTRVLMRLDFLVRPEEHL